MGSNVNRLEMLSVIDDLHEKYQFTDGEYKKMVETLSGKTNRWTCRLRLLSRVGVVRQTSRVCPKKESQMWVGPLAPRGCVDWMMGCPAHPRGVASFWKMIKDLPKKIIIQGTLIV
jgi:hypothetical protein